MLTPVCLEVTDTVDQVGLSHGLPLLPDPASLSSWNKGLFPNLESLCFLYHFPCLKFILPSPPASSYQIWWNTSLNIISSKDFSDSLLLSSVYTVPPALQPLSPHGLGLISASDVDLAPWILGIWGQRPPRLQSVKHHHLTLLRRLSLPVWSVLFWRLVPQLRVLCWLYSFSGVAALFCVLNTRPLDIQWRGVPGDTRPSLMLAVDKPILSFLETKDYFEKTIDPLTWKADVCENRTHDTKSLFTYPRL